MSDIVWVPLFDGQSTSTAWYPSLRRNIEKLKPNYRPYFEDVPPVDAPRIPDWEQRIEKLRALDG